MAQYLRTRRTMSSHATGSPLLARVILMADARVGLTDMDKRVLNALEDTLLPLHVVLSKCDLATPRETPRGRCCSRTNNLQEHSGQAASW